MTILRKPLKRELPERIAHRQLVVELHPSFVRFREKRSRTVWDISWESIYRTVFSGGHPGREPHSRTGAQRFTKQSHLALGHTWP